MILNKRLCRAFKYEDSESKLIKCLVEYKFNKCYKMKNILYLNYNG